MDSDRRRHPRLPMEVEVELYLPGHPTRVVQTEDLSSGGVLLLMDESDRPPLGLSLILIVRYAGEGVAVQFSDE